MTLELRLPASVLVLAYTIPEVVAAATATMRISELRFEDKTALLCPEKQQQRVIGFV